ncbi:amidohydrolase [Xylariaceae sp. FL1272]|nr:amidohydrolase [Xylariaceae sp. FL1272]
MTRRTIAKTPTARQATPSPKDALPDYVYSTAFGIPVRPRGDCESNARAQANHVTEEPFYTIIKTGLLIPGDGEPLENGALVIEKKIIVWVGLEAELPAKYTDASNRAFAIPFVMPGLWDVHAHFGGEPTNANEGDLEAIMASQHPATGGARLTKGCWEAIQRGYTSLRDVAGFGCEVARAINDDSIVGPNVYSAGACLSQTGGHGDIHNIPPGDVHLNAGVSTVRPGHWGSTMALLCDGVDECRRAVRLQIRRGAKCIKIFASGGVLSLEDNPLYAQFSPEEMKCIVEEAARSERIVAAHVHGKPGIMAAVNAGVGSVEHVSFADDECIELIKKKGTLYVATRSIVDMLIQGGGKGLTKYQWEKAQLCNSNHLRAYKAAIKAGVTFALGTDAPPGFNMAVELDFAVKAGMTSLEAIKCATANGPLSVGAMAPKTGQLKAGYEADILGLHANPVEDVKVLQDRDTIGWVWKGGRLFKGPGVGPWGEDPL